MASVDRDPTRWGTSAEVVPIERLDYDESSGVVENAYLADGGHITPTGWGVECTNWYSFFSQEKMSGRNVEIKESSLRSDAGTMEARLHLDFQKGAYLVHIEEQLSNGTLQRRYRMTALRESLFGDFVLRSRFGAQPGDKIIIGDDVQRHAGTDLNHYYQPRETHIKCGDSYWLRSKNIRFESPSPSNVDVKEIVYYRDEPTHTRLHYRFLSTGSPYLSALGWVIPLKGIYSKGGSWLRPSLQNSVFMGRERNRNRRFHRYWQLVANTTMERGEYLEIKVENDVLRIANHTIR